MVNRGRVVMQAWGQFIKKEHRKQQKEEWKTKDLMGEYQRVAEMTHSTTRKLEHFQEVVVPDKLKNRWPKGVANISRQMLKIRVGTGTGWTQMGHYHDNVHQAIHEGSGRRADGTYEKEPWGHKCIYENCNGEYANFKHVIYTCKHPAIKEIREDMKERIENIIQEEIRYHPNSEHQIMDDINRKCKGAAERKRQTTEEDIAKYPMLHKLGWMVDRKDAAAFCKAKGETEWEMAHKGVVPKELGKLLGDKAGETQRKISHTIAIHITHIHGTHKKDCREKAISITNKDTVGREETSEESEEEDTKPCEGEACRLRESLGEGNRRKVQTRDKVCRECKNDTSRIKTVQLLKDATQDNNLHRINRRWMKEGRDIKEIKEWVGKMKTRNKGITMEEYQLERITREAGFPYKKNGRIFLPLAPEQINCKCECQEQEEETEYGPCGNCMKQKGRMEIKSDTCIKCNEVGTEYGCRGCGGGFHKECCDSEHIMKQHMICRECIIGYARKFHKINNVEKGRRWTNLRNNEDANEIGGNIAQVDTHIRKNILPNPSIRQKEEGAKNARINEIIEGRRTQSIRSMEVTAKNMGTALTEGQRKRILDRAYEEQNKRKKQ